MIRSPQQIQRWNRLTKSVLHYKAYGSSMSPKPYLLNEARPYVVFKQVYHMPKRTKDWDSVDREMAAKRDAVELHTQFKERQGRHTFIEDATGQTNGNSFTFSPRARKIINDPTTYFKRIREPTRTGLLTLPREIGAPSPSSNTGELRHRRCDFLLPPLWIKVVTTP
ncbi:unnamed protein product [Rhizophagus irregularis]|nr:unnamed protein product [Rhizophagus irregularis]